MKKYVHKLLVIILAFMLAGCMKVRMSLDVGNNAEVKGTMTLLIQEKLLTIGGNSAADEVEAMIRDYQDQYPGAAVSAAEEGEGDDKYLGITISGFQSDTFKAEKDGSVLTLRLPMSAVTGYFSNMPSAGGSAVGLKELKSYGAELTLRVSMPSRISANAGIVSGNTVTIDLLDLPDGLEEIVITGRTALPWPAMIGAAAVFAAGCGGVYYIRRRKEQEASNL